jgi:hypothetical protein
MTAEKIELRYLAQDIQLFLRMAATHFTHPNDLRVIEPLRGLAVQYGHGQDIRKAR